MGRSTAGLSQSMRRPANYWQNSKWALESVGNPITYTGPDGKQYVAVYAGFGGDWFLVSGDVRADDPTMCGRRRIS